METRELAPASVAAGHEVNHHLVYVLCPGKTTKGITGTRYRHLPYQGRLVFEEITKGFAFKPGTWSVEALIEVLPTAQAGVYVLPGSFTAQAVRLEEVNPRVVNRP